MRGRAAWVMILLAAGAACSRGEDASAHLTGELSSQGLRIEEIFHHQFRDLDEDGVKEILVHGRGNLRGASTLGALVLSFQASPPDNGGGRLFLPSNLAWDRFVGVFRFDRASFHWVPQLIGTYRPEKVQVTQLGTEDFDGDCLVRVGFEAEGRVSDLLYRLGPAGMEKVFASQRGSWVGEGFYIRGPKLFTAVGLPNPFEEGGRPGFLAKTRYRWEGGAFLPEFWSLSGYGFQADLTDSLADHSQRPQVQRVRELQRASDRGLTLTRLSLTELAARRFGENPYQLVYEKGGFGVVLQEVNRRVLPHYYVQPFHRARPKGQAVWVDLEDLDGGD